MILQVNIPVFLLNPIMICCGGIHYGRFKKKQERGICYSPGLIIICQHFLVLTVQR